MNVKAWQISLQHDVGTILFKLRTKTLTWCDSLNHILMFVVFASFFSLSPSSLHLQFTISTVHQHSSTIPNHFDLFSKNSVRIESATLATKYLKIIIEAMCRVVDKFLHHWNKDRCMVIVGCRKKIWKDGY